MRLLLSYLKMKYLDQSQIYDLTSKFFHPHDVRCIKHENRILMFYSSCKNEKYTTIQSELSNNSICNEKELFGDIELYGKNWIPFTNSEGISLIYSMQPYTILHYNNGFCSLKFVSSKQINWKWGNPSGGSTPILIGNHYLSIFHSWLSDSRLPEHYNTQPREYYIGAFLFDKNPPFDIKYMSRKPLEYRDFYNSQPSFHKVIFPMSLNLINNQLTMSYGENDSTTKIAIFDTTRLLNSLSKI